MKKKILQITMLLMTALSLTGCIFTQKIKYHEPKYYDFNLSKVSLKETEVLEPKKHVDFLDEHHLFVKMPTWFYVKMLDNNDIRKRHLKIYKQLYMWALEDVERYSKFVEKQKDFFKNLNNK